MPEAAEASAAKRTAAIQRINCVREISPALSEAPTRSVRGPRLPSVCRTGGWCFCDGSVWWQAPAAVPLSYGVFSARAGAREGAVGLTGLCALPFFGRTLSVARCLGIVKIICPEWVERGEFRHLHAKGRMLAGRLGCDEMVGVSEMASRPDWSSNHFLWYCRTIFRKFSAAVKLLPRL
jgi:hypothetical protein